MHKLTSSGPENPKQLRAEFELIINEYKHERADEGLMQRLFNEHSDRRAVIMGRSNSLTIVLVINCIVCVMFFLQGLVMYITANATFEACKETKSDPERDI
jgi:hypothetical protein